MCSFCGYGRYDVDCQQAGNNQPGEAADYYDTGEVA